MDYVEDLKKYTKTVDEDAVKAMANIYRLVLSQPDSAVVAFGDPGELEFLGLDPAEARLWLVEWPERGQGALPAADLDISCRWRATGAVAISTRGPKRVRCGWRAAATAVAARCSRPGEEYPAGYGLLREK